MTDVLLVLLALSTKHQNIVVGSIFDSPFGIYLLLPEIEGFYQQDGGERHLAIFLTITLLDKDMATGICDGTVRVRSGGQEFLFNSSHQVIPGGQLSIIPGRDKILLEGCGCFLLYQGAGKVGRAFLLSRPGLHHYNLHIIGSVFKQVSSTTCDSQDIPD